MVIITHFRLSVKQYAQAQECPGREEPVPERCPHAECQAAGSLIRWGTYERWACTGHGDYRLTIQRLRCKECGRTHSLLPDFLHPYRHYVHALLQEVVWLYLIVGLGFERLWPKLPEQGPARSTVREWVGAFAYGAGYLLLNVLRRELLNLAPDTPLSEPPPPHLERRRPAQRRQWLRGAHRFWELAQQLYAQIKERQAWLQFSLSQLLPFVLHWLQQQGLPPRLFWSPLLSTSPSHPF